MEAYQISDQGLELFRAEQIVPSSDQGNVTVKNTVIVEGKETTAIDNHLLLLVVRYYVGYVGSLTIQDTCGLY